MKVLENEEGRQFRVLVRHFAYRFLDHELIAAGGDLAQTAVNLVALLGAFGFLITCKIFSAYFFLTLWVDWEQRRLLAGPDQVFLVSCAMGVTGLVTVFFWDTLFPDRNDCLTLATLPLRQRTVFGAKIAAIAFVPLVAGIAVSALPGIVLPLMLLPHRAPVLQYVNAVAAYTAALAAAGAFVFFVLLGVQGLLVCLLGYRLFQRVSSYVQLGAFLAILAAFFLVPTVRHPLALAAPENQELGRAVPLFWFVALYETLLGTENPVLRALEGRAFWALLASGLFAVTTYAIGYSRRVRQVIEQSDFVPQDLTHGDPWWQKLAGKILVRRPRERAVFHFIARSLYRSRQHRLLLALFGGVGLASLLYDVGRIIRSGARERWFQPVPELLLAPVILSFFLLIGMRVAFSIPLELKANWIFQLTDEGEPAPCLSATRKTLVLLGVMPSLLLIVPCFFLWSPEDAARHLVFVVLMVLVMVEALLRRFSKIPFTCSFLPGKANLKVRFGIYWAIFTAASALLWRLERWGLRTPASYVGLVAAMLAAVVVLRRRGGKQEQGLVYEESPEPVITLLELRP